jgi:DNA-binding Lrp family transcriptional regulator
MPKLNVDEVDFKIANALRENARISYKRLGEMVSLSTPSAYERAKKLESKGVILDYKAEVDYGKFGYGIHAFILLKDDKIFGEAPEYLRALEYVQNCWVISGEYDYMLEVYVENDKTLSLILDQLFSKVGRAHTILIIRNARYSPYAEEISGRE